MSGLRENEGPPGTDALAQTQAVPIAVRGKALVEEFGDLHPLKLGQQHRNIIYAFVTQGKVLGHVESLPQFLKTAQKMSEP
jgi:hypothetical protein